MITKYKKFMLESNKIEGENRVNPGDIDAVLCVITIPVDNMDVLFSIHAILGAYLQKDWVGKLRTVNVRVGGFCPPIWQNVPLAMQEYFDEFINMTSWEAHNEFEKIHPFQDLNGRVGRLIWLSKAIHEGYNFSIPFLQAYYYQTLHNYESRTSK